MRWFFCGWMVALLSMGGLAHANGGCRLLYTQGKYQKAGFCYKRRARKLSGSKQKSLKGRLMRNAAACFARAARGTKSVAVRSFFYEQAAIVMRSYLRQKLAENDHRRRSAKRLKRSFTKRIRYARLHIFTEKNARVVVKGYAFQGRSAGSFKRLLRPGPYKIKVTTPEGEVTRRHLWLRPSQHRQVRLQGATNAPALRPVPAPTIDDGLPMGMTDEPMTPPRQRSPVPRRVEPPALRRTQPPAPRKRIRSLPPRRVLSPRPPQEAFAPSSSDDLLDGYDREFRKRRSARLRRPAPPPPPSNGALQAGAWVGIGLGVAIVAGGIVMLLVANDKYTVAQKAYEDAPQRAGGLLTLPRDQTGSIAAGFKDAQTYQGIGWGGVALGGAVTLVFGVWAIALTTYPARPGR